MMQIVIVGVGGLGRTTHEIIEECNARQPQFEVLGFLDEDRARHGESVHGLCVLDGLEWLREHPDAGVVVAVGEPDARKRLVEKLRAMGVERFPSVIHPTAQISRRATVGQGAIIKPFCVIQTSARVGEFVSMSSYSTFSHDCEIGTFVQTGPHACVVGLGRVGDGCYLGAGSVVLADAQVGAWSTIGANATVVRAIPDRSTAVGTPARVIETNAS